MGFWATLWDLSGYLTSAGMPYSELPRAQWIYENGRAALTPAQLETIQSWDGAKQERFLGLMRAAYDNRQLYGGDVGDLVRSIYAQADTGNPVPSTEATQPPATTRPPVATPPVDRAPPATTTPAPDPEAVRLEARLAEARRMVDAAYAANLRGRMGGFASDRVEDALTTLFTAGKIDAATYSDRLGVLESARRFSAAMAVIRQSVDGMAQGPSRVGPMGALDLELALSTIESTPGLSREILNGRRYARDVVDRFKARLTLNAAEQGGELAPTHGEINDALLTVQRVDPANLGRATQLYEWSYAATYPGLPVPDQPTGSTPRASTRAGSTPATGRGRRSRSLSRSATSSTSWGATTRRAACSTA